MYWYNVKLSREETKLLTARKSIIIGKKWKNIVAKQRIRKKTILDHVTVGSQQFITNNL